MQGYYFNSAGIAREVLRFGDCPAPSPGPGEVQVKVAVSAVNPTDTKRRADGRELGKFPTITPNNDGSGIIENVGAGIDAKRIGERVWLFGAQAGRPYGTGAQLCTVPAAYAVPLPVSTSLETGACLGVPAVTAHRAVFADGPVSGMTVLITGGAGRVGRYAVQMARNAGATVIATCSTDHDEQDLQALGVNHIVRRQTQDIQQATLALTNGDGVDRMIDVAFGANIHRAPAMIKPNGVLTSYGSDENPEPGFPFYQFMFRNITIRPFSIMGMPNAAKQQAFQDITTDLENNSLSHRISAQFNWNEMIEAHEAVERGDQKGCVLVNL